MVSDDSKQWWGHMNKIYVSTYHVMFRMKVLLYFNYTFRFNANQLHFLNRTFPDGALNSPAESSPTTAAKMMRSLECPVTGDKVFQPKEWLKVKQSQIKSFFSRCYIAQKKSGSAPTMVETSCVCERCRSGPGLETESLDNGAG